MSEQRYNNENKVILTGRIFPSKYMQQGTEFKMVGKENNRPMLKICMEHLEKNGEFQRKDFFFVTAFGRAAEDNNNSLVVNDIITISGHLESYKSKPEIIVERIDKVGHVEMKEDNQQGSSDNEKPEPETQTAAPEPQQQESSVVSSNVPSGSIPF